MGFKGAKYGSWNTVVGKNYVGTGGRTSGSNTKRLSTKGYYQVGFVKEYQNLTEKDIMLKLEYGKDLVSSYTGVPADMIKLRKKKEGQTLASLDTVYYVSIGKEPVGKLSIRAQRRFREVGLTFIYLEKNYVQRKLRGGNVRSVGYTNATKSQKRKADRRKSNKSKTTR
ncbi:hypothetical protein NGDEOPKE_00163 [Enterococcus phage vB_OCPT_Carl]|uniref:Uncharacterized protein n=2 Tax=Kochikohdavirus TaxID=2560160 RepID=A0A0E3XC41_9CAUD|nr:hypothetical protein AVT53_gp096 [Enterococcus phage EFLK1]AZU99991.1 hypothetical protein vBEfaHEF1TV_147 [Enterococcus phage vB_EfaH_EF1TV]QPW37259.1 hypothetical protein [Enterococcus phage PBEF129]UQT00112.1 hypothetical protein NGDEOPKE_00163 [Enterococcus phage vB_OCPT_Carl]WDQ27712.1 hypothetical protein EF53_080 [Enterococcus phage 53]AKC05083.1 hypothetical protein [Enterococcus phage EFLK1]